MSNVNLEITPANVASDGIISYKSGNPVIQFIIGEQERLLLGQTIRLVGKFRARKGSGDTEGDYVISTDKCHMDGRLGIYNVIDQLVVKSQSTHQTIEHIRHYNRFCSSFVPALNALEDQTGHLSESALIMPNSTLAKESVLDIPSQRQTGNAFCAHLPCGLFNGANRIPLSQDTGVGGLLVEIHLAPDENVFYESGGAGANISNTFYELFDVSLVAEAAPMSADMNVGNTMEYNSISSYYTSVNSTNSVLNFNLGLSRVLGVFANFISATCINNLSFNGMATGPIVKNETGVGQAGIANIDQVVFTKGGVRFPLEYNVDTVQKDQATNAVPDAQVLRNFLSGLRPFSKLGKSGISPNNTFLSKHERTAAINADYITADGGSVYGVGVSYDGISGDGVDFSRQNFGLQMTSGLDSDRPTAVYVFVHSKQTLVFNSSGVQVMS